MALYICSKKSLLNPGRSRNQTKEAFSAMTRQRKENVFSSSCSAKFLIYVFLSDNTAVHCWGTLRSGASILRDQIGGLWKKVVRRENIFPIMRLVALANPTRQKGRNQNKTKEAGLPVLTCRSFFTILRSQRQHKTSQRAVVEIQ